MTGSLFCRLVEMRLRGGPMAAFPWETADGERIPGINPYCDPRTAAPLIAAERAVAQRIGHPNAMTIQPHLVAPDFVASAPPNPLQPHWIAQGSVNPQRTLIARGKSVSDRPPVSNVNAIPAFGVFIQYVSARQIR